MANSRADYLVKSLVEANKILYSKDRTLNERERLPRASQDKHHAEHALKNILQGKTLESEAKEVLKMEEKDKLKYYREVFHSGGNGALKELYSEIDKQKKPTFTIAKTVEAQVKDVLELNSEWRKKYYQNLRNERGQKALDVLLCAVRKQRTKSNAMEM